MLFNVGFKVHDEARRRTQEGQITDKEESGDL